MAAKTDAKEAPAPPPEPAAAPPAAPASPGLKAWIPAIVVVLLAPTLSWAVAEFVLLPRLQAKLAAGPGEAHATAPAPSSGHAPSGHGKESAGNAVDTFEFTNVVVNLSGTMGTRYLKCSFVITGAEPGIKATFDGRKAQLTDVTLNVLSSLTLADLEEPGAKNVLRERLVATYNQTLGRRVAEQVYFSDFVVQ